MTETIRQILPQVAEAAIILVVGVIVIAIIGGIEKRALKKSKLDDALHPFIINGTKAITWIVLLIILLSRLGVNTASLIAVISAAGAAIALALKDSLGNIAGGIIILINKPFFRGDTIELNGTVGVVDEIDLLATRLHTVDNKEVSVPNGAITTNILINYSRREIRRVDCVFCISYDSDIVRAEEILQQVATSNPNILEDPEPIIGVASHGDNGIFMDLKAWCPTDLYFDVQYFLQEKVKLAFDEAGIDIPYPHMDVHVVKSFNSFNK